MVLVRGVDILSLERYKVVQFVFFFNKQIKLL